MSDLYYQAICARTFPGASTNPLDYKKQNQWVVAVEDFPNSEIDGVMCNVEVDFGSYSESPAATQRVLLDTDEYDICSRDSYCETLAELIDKYPGISDADPYRCNVNPTGDPDELGPWICVGSSTDACGYAVLPNENFPNETEICPLSTPSVKDFCVLATEATATDECFLACEDASNGFDFLGMLYTDPFDCTIFTAPATMTWAADPGEDCANFWAPAAGLIPFSYSASLTIDGGAHASIPATDTLGFLDFSVSNCGGGFCDIVVSEIYLPHMDYSGTFYDSLNDPFPFTVSGISLALMKPVEGTVTQNFSAPWSVAFPEWDFKVLLDVDEVSLDGIPFSFGDATVRHVSGVTGTYSTVGVLSLDIQYETEDATMTLSLASF